MRSADRARSRDGEGLGILSQDSLILSGIRYVPEVPASSFPSFLGSPLLKLSYPHQLIWERTKKPPSGHMRVGVPPPILSPYPKLLLAQNSFDNPEWFYRHVEAHSLCCEYQVVGKDNNVVLCGWKGRATP